MLVAGAIKMGIKRWVYGPDFEYQQAQLNPETRSLIDTRTNRALRPEDEYTKEANANLDKEFEFKDINKQTQEHALAAGGDYGNVMKNALNQRASRNYKQDVNLLERKNANQSIDRKIKDLINSRREQSQLAEQDREIAIRIRQMQADEEEAKNQVVGALIKGGASAVGAVVGAYFGGPMGAAAGAAAGRAVGSTVAPSERTEGSSSERAEQRRYEYNQDTNYDPNRRRRPKSKEQEPRNEPPQKRSTQNTSYREGPYDWSEYEYFKK